MNRQRRRFTLRPLLCWLFFLPALLPAGADSATDPSLIETKPMYPIPLLQTLEGAGVRHGAKINGFDADWLLHVRADSSARAAGLETRMTGYAVIHPYFLRPGANELRIELKADDAARLTSRVAAMGYVPDKDLGTVFVEHELLRLVAPPAGVAATRTLSGTFQWADVPAWAWAGAPAIADTPENRESLQAAVERLLEGLHRMAKDPASAEPWAEVSRASMHDFIQASELQGRRFTLLDDLTRISSTLMLAGDQTPESFMKSRESRSRVMPGQPSNDDQASPHPPVGRLANGELPPRLSMRKLDTFDGLTMNLFADGRLARLVDASGQPVIQFVSNYSDGNRGSPNPVRFVCDPWFRLNAAQQWELDAIYPSLSAHQTLANPWPQQMFEQLPY